MRIDIETRTLPLLDETISRDTLDCLRDRAGSLEDEDSLLLSIEANKSSFVAPAG